MPAARAPRYFATDKVRDAENLIPEGLLTFDPATNRLTLAGGSRAETARSENVECKLTEILNVLADDKAGGGDGMNTTRWAMPN